MLNIAIRACIWQNVAMNSSPCVNVSQASVATSLIRSLFTGLCLSIGLATATLAAAERKPNVLLLLADDFRDFGGAFTRKCVQTPNLDRLRAHGMTFERAYVQYSVCNPSRSSFLTGLRPEQTGIVGNTERLRERMPEVVTLPQLCKEHGWQAEAFGKIFHLGGKTKAERELWMDSGRSWHAAQAFEPTALGQKMIEARNVTADELKWCRWGAADGCDDDQPDGQIATATIAAIERLGDQPWFLGCGFMKPHDPFVAPKKYFDLYPPAQVKIWRDPSDMTPSLTEAVGFGLLGKVFSTFTDTEWAELLRGYCAATTFMDAELGRVLDTLDRHKLWDSTIVIFAGDNGYHTGERQWWNKDTLFERSCRVPLIIAAPGVKGGEVTRSLVELVDLYPTIAEFCHIAPPHPMAGRSLRPILANPDAKIKGAAFTLVTRGPKLYGQSVRTENWRFTQWSDGAQELYDNGNDPEENHNVASVRPEVVGELAAQLKTLPPYRPTVPVKNSPID